MNSFTNLYELPENLPAPTDDGACDHLPGMRVPSVALSGTSGRLADLSSLAGRTVVYCYSRTGRPGEEMPAGWDDIPGARGCTPQTCAFRGHYAELKGLGAAVFGLSTQTTEDQREVVERLHLPFDLLSDAGLSFASALRLPTFEVRVPGNEQGASMVLLKRLTLILRDGVIEHVFYPVFPPNKNAEQVISWLTENPLP
jgi:peroxiredoxin